LPSARCVVTGVITGNSTIRTYYPLSAKMKQQGDKKPDTFEAIFPMSNDVDQNYEISYIQDIVDTTWLSAVYPMQLSCLDESGYNQDPTDPPESRFIKVTSGKFKGHYALDFNAESQGVSVPDPRLANGGKINLSGQFDINTFFTPNTTQFIDGNSEPIVWSFLSGSKGVEIGISNQYDNVWRVFIRVYGSSPEGYRGSLYTVMTGAPVHIRCKRGSDDILKVYVNGEQEQLKNTTSGSSAVWNGSVTVSLQPTSATSMIFGSGNGNNDHYKGQIHEIKVYCGGSLSLSDAKRVWTTKPIAQYMKFNGLVRKMESKQTSKKIYCQSNSYRITTYKLGGIYNAPTPVDFGEIIISYTDGNHTLEVGKKISGSTSGAFGTVKSVTSSGSSPHQTGTITIIERNQFSFTDGEDLIEQEGVPPTGTGSNSWEGVLSGGTGTYTHTFKSIAQASVDSASSSTFTIRNIDPFAFVSSGVYSTLTGSIYAVGSVVDYLGILLTYSDCVMYFTPRKNIIIESNAGHATDYVFDQDNKVYGCNITDSETNDTKLVTQVILSGRPLSKPYPAFPTAVAGHIQSVEKSVTPSDGITRTLRRNVKQLSGGVGTQDLSELGDKLKNNLSGKFNNTFGKPYPRYSIKVINSVHYARYNQIILVKRKNGNNTSITFDPVRSNTDVNLSLKVRQVEWNYPSGLTIINAGENNVDFGDQYIKNSKTTDELVDSSLV